MTSQCYNKGVIKKRAEAQSKTGEVGKVGNIMKKTDSKAQDRIIVNGESVPVTKNTMMPVTRTEVRIDSLTSQTLAEITNDVRALQNVGKKATLLICGRVGFMVENWEELGQGVNKTALNYMADELGLSKQSTSAMNRVYKRFITDGATATLSIDGDWSYGQLMELLAMEDEEIEAYIETKELAPTMSAARIRGLVKDCKEARNSIPTTATEESKPESKPENQPESKPENQPESKPETEQERDAHIQYARDLETLHKKILRLIAQIGSVDGKMTKDGSDLDRAYVEMVKALGYYEMTSILGR